MYKLLHPSLIFRLVSNSTISGTRPLVMVAVSTTLKPAAAATLELSNAILNTGISGENTFNDGGTVKELARADWAAEMQHVPGLSPGEERPLRVVGMG